MTEDQNAKRELLLAWHERATRANLAHYFQAEECAKINNILTIFNLLAAISVLYLVNNRHLNETATTESVFLSLASLAVVLSTALHYVLKLEERSQDHKLAGYEFTAIKRRIEKLLVRGNLTDDDITSIETEHNHTTKNHGLVRQAQWIKIKKRLSEATEENRKFFENLRGNTD